MITTFDFQLTNDHPHIGKRVRLIPGDLPDSVQGIMIGTIFMARCEDETGQHYYATEAQLRYVRTPVSLGTCTPNTSQR